MRTTNARALTPLERAVLESGRDLDWFARRLAERGPSPRELQSARSTLRGVLRNGNASWNYAQRIAVLLGAVESPLHDLLLKPRACWPRWALDGALTPHQGAMGTPGKSETIAVSGAVASRSRRHASKQSRMEILEVV